MLLKFTIENFKSFRDKIDFYMLPTKKRTHKEYIIHKKLKNRKTAEALPVVIIYGPNASGKTNLILSMKILKEIVMAGTIDSEKLNEISCLLKTVPFIYDENYYEPIKFSISFEKNRKIYEYGINISKKNKGIITYEFLNVNNKNIFTREEDNIIVNFKYMKKEKIIPDKDYEYYDSVLKDLIKNQNKKQLFLESGIGNVFNKNIYKEIRNWFKNFVVITDLEKIKPSKIEMMKDLKAVDNNFFISRAVNDIIGFAEFGRREIEFKETSSKDIAMLSVYKNPDKIKKSINNYEDEESSEILIKSEMMESKGTMQLLALINPFVEALKNGGQIILDEMDASLHFEITVALIHIFNNQSINTKGAQLIFNTHNPVYLDGNLLRHDQIAMIEKNKENFSSELYYISDYDLSPKENLLKNYLNGKYGALPHMDLEIAFKRILTERKDD